MTYIIIFASILFTILVYKFSIFRNLKSLLNRMFWVERFSSEANAKRSGIKSLIFISKALMMLYIFFIAMAILLPIVHFDLQLSSTMILGLFLIPMMYRFVFILTAKLHKIN